MKLSVALAVFNEKENIEKCLKSIERIADEIIIVDGGSDDGTLEILKKYPVKIIKTDNPPIFHINKQKALDACSGDWILQLDADEVVSDKLRNEIKEVVDNKNSKYVGFYLKRRNFFLGRWLKKGGQYPDPVIRFFRNKKGHFPCVSVHEQIQIDGEVGMLNNDLLHYAVLDFSKYLTNSNRYTSLTASEYLSQKLKTNFWNSLLYIFILPTTTFLKLFLRHRGYVDGFSGFVFALYSGLHIRTSYIKYWEMVHKND